ncbi:MAG: hypothetical protein A2W99_15105 [Bacteroidetes bacterium GWF2_33_16]|nr:MAG: hypothetical protein A2W99_15105 [Bacteroidetes bacterium GWF2_33_16]
MKFPTSIYKPTCIFLERRKYISFLLLCLITFTGFAQTNVNTLKAVYLEKFSRFVTWPEECMMNDINQPFIISIIGETKLTENLHLVYSQQEINNKRVIIRVIKDLKEIEGSHILFIAESEKKNIQKLQQITNGLPILTVSETKGFSEKGILINFYEEDKKLRFEINETAVLKSPLKMSYYLLSTARIIEPVKD